MKSDNIYDLHILYDCGSRTNRSNDFLCSNMFIQLKIDRKLHELSPNIESQHQTDDFDKNIWLIIIEYTQ